MTPNGWLKILAFAVLGLLVTKPAGLYILRVYDGSQRWLAPVERAVYRLGGMDPAEDQHWTRYATGLLIFSAVSMLVTYVALRPQGHLPLNPFHRAGVVDGQAFETAASFTTNTNWQSYAGETVILREWSRTPVIVISARGREQDKIAALDAGADDYLTKPFGLGELLARLRVALRRTASAADGDPVFAVGDLKVDLAARLVFRRGAEVHLTPIEYKLPTTLARHAGKVVTHRQLLKEAWGPNAVEHAHYVRVYMTQLRHKLEDEPSRPKYLLTESGVGYRLRAE